MPAFRTIVVTVDDLDAAKRVYSVALGVEPHTDTPYYVGYNVDGCEFGLSPKPGDGRDGSVPYVDHADRCRRGYEDRRPRRRRRQPVRCPLLDGPLTTGAPRPGQICAWRAR